MNFVRDRMDLPQFGLLDEMRQGRARMHVSMETLKVWAISTIEIVLRVPGLILLELWWRKRDMSFDELAEDLMGDQNSTMSYLKYLDVATFLDFIHQRNMENSVATTLSISVIVFSFTILMISLPHLFRFYAHALSIALFGFAHYMSATYVALEENSPETVVKLDSFVALERHGFHFMAQAMLATLQCFVLGLESELARVCMVVYLFPIIARMCSFPQMHLIQVHNAMCSLIMSFMCLYVLHKVPRIWERIMETGSTMRTLLATRGLAVGVISIWRRSRCTDLLTFTWLSLFVLKCCQEHFGKGRSWHDTWPIILEGIAETTNTPLTMLALALAISCVCSWVLQLAQWFISAANWSPQHVLVNNNYMSCFFLILVCTQTGLLGMKSEAKSGLLGLILFIVLSALLHSLFELVEGQTQMLATSRDHARTKHVRALSLACGLVAVPVGVASTAYAFLPMNLWTCILLSNLAMTTIHSGSAIIQYAIARAESSADGWLGAETAAFVTTLVTKMLEIACAMTVIGVGAFVTVNGEWTVASFGVLLLQIIFNVFHKIEFLYEVFRKRSEAEANLNRLKVASDEEIKRHADVCAICLQEMLSEGSREKIRITPCQHLFHSACLKRWLSVKQVCPMCYADLSLPKRASANSSRRGSISGDAAAAERRRARAGLAGELEEMERLHRQLDAARDIWPLVGLNYDSDDFDTEEEESLAEDYIEPTPEERAQQQRDQLGRIRGLRQSLRETGTFG